MIDVIFEGFRYHKPLPNFYKTGNPQNPKREITEDLLEDLLNLALKYNFSGISYSKLSDDLKEEIIKSRQAELQSSKKTQRPVYSKNKNSDNKSFKTNNSQKEPKVFEHVNSKKD